MLIVEVEEKQWWWFCDCVLGGGVLLGHEVIAIYVDKVKFMVLAFISVGIVHLSTMSISPNMGDLYELDLFFVINLGFMDFLLLFYCDY